MRIMGKERFKPDRKIMAGEEDNSAGDNKGRQSHKNKSLIDRECSKDSGFKKRVIIKDDGRYLIYYDF